MGLNLANMTDIKSSTSIFIHSVGSQIFGCLVFLRKYFKIVLKKNKQICVSFFAIKLANLLDSGGDVS